MTIKRTTIDSEALSRPDPCPDTICIKLKPDKKTLAERLAEPSIIQKAKELQ